MSKKKNDTYDDAKEEGTSLEAFVLPQRIDAFVDAYQPSTENIATNTFNETKLRNFFKAWPCSLGDPLSIYLDRLKEHGFNLAVSISGDLAIFTVEKNVSSKVLTTIKSIESEQSDEQM